MRREALARKRLRAEAILTGLRELYPTARTELDFGDAFQLLVATMLSAQATDVSVNRATPALFAAFPNAATMSRAAPETVEPYIRTIGLFRTKAANLVATSRLLVEKHGGNVPSTIAELMQLPGVGRKTANVVVSNAFDEPAIAVDTHVGRLARRLGLSAHSNPDKVEADLMRVFPRQSWVFAHHALILHGRRVCKARTPLCSACALCDVCPSCGTFETPARATGA
ncbi:MAG TPA: endonuclease III [Trueperaceae bacterium]|nr:endonuclease III [Trueperaceae bacterium]